MRAKRRYFTVEIQSSKTNFSKADIEASILNAVEQMHGAYGLASVSSFAVKYWNNVTGITLLRIYFGPHKFITSVLPLVNKIAGNSVVIHTIFVGATLKRCYLNIQKYEVNELEKLWLNLTTKEQKKKYKKGFLDSNIQKLLKGDPS